MILAQINFYLVQIAKQTLWKYSYPTKYWWKLFV